MNLLCPGCGNGLATVETESGMVAACEVCGGQWLDNAASQAVSLNDLTQVARNLVNPRIQAPPKGGMVGGYRQAARGPDADRSCPVCSGALIPHVTEERRFGVAIAVDVCAAHGTWFDRGEAWALLQALALEHQEAEYTRKIAQAGGAADTQAAFIEALRRGRQS